MPWPAELTPEPMPVMITKDYIPPGMDHPLYKRGEIRTLLRGAAMVLIGLGCAESLRHPSVIVSDGDERDTLS
jgi:hypothetical protein